MRKVALVCDYLEENWPSMDLFGEMLSAFLPQAGHDSGFRFELVRPALRHRPGFNLTADRLANRFWDYPRHIARIASGFDLFHLMDHSYSQLLHSIPAGRTVVTCHDIDTFRSVVDPASDPRSLPFRLMARRIMTGMSKAAAVLCVSQATKDAVLRYRLAEPARVHLVPPGASPAFVPHADPDADAEAARLLAPAGDVYLLHVGSTIPRKRIDMLLRIFAEVRRRIPSLTLVRVGGALTPQQNALAAELGVAPHIVILPFITREVLAAVYRRAQAVLQPSEAEGFGLPVAEAMACGCPVVATDIPTLREVGGEAAVFCPLNDLEAWAAAVAGVVQTRQAGGERWESTRASLLAAASRFSWAENARKTVAIYRSVLGAI